MSKVWFITGANRGIGLEIARAALRAGDSVVATARDAGKIAGALGSQQANVLAVNLDVTQPAQAAAAVTAATQRFGRIDVLVNNAGYGQLGVFEESSSEDVQQQFRVNVFGAMDVTRAVLPVMRKQRSGHLFNITSIAGLRGGPGGSLYSATKFAMEGLSESLSLELAPFGIHVTAVEPGYFRTDFLDSSSVRHASGSIGDYAEAADKTRAFFQERNHRQAGDPAKLATALIQLANEAQPPLHFLAGTDAVGVMEMLIDRNQKELAKWRHLSSSTDHN
jgi:NAD(P)-dependent dehydrogenase (short-subunit alcohol dehydrogenase family)